MLGNLREKLSKTRLAFKQRLDGLVKSGKPREEILEELTEALILADVGVTATEKVIDSLRFKTLKTDGFSEILDALKADLTTRLANGAAELRLGPPPAVLMAVESTAEQDDLPGQASPPFPGRRKKDRTGRRRHLPGCGPGTALGLGATSRPARHPGPLWRRPGLGRFRRRPVRQVPGPGHPAGRHRRAHPYQCQPDAGAGENQARPGPRDPRRPHEILLILDASIGQNALIQAREFLKVSGLTGIILTKLDGTAKGGIVVAIADELGLPIKFVGTGETDEDLVEFSRPRSSTRSSHDRSPRSRLHGNGPRPGG